MSHIQNFKFPSTYISESKKEINEINISNIFNFTKYIQNITSMYN